MDSVNAAFQEALISALLGSTTVYHQTVDTNGQSTIGTIKLESIFEQRLRSQAMSGAFDDILNAAMEKISVERVAEALEGLLADRFVAGLKVDNTWGRSTGWLETKARDIAVEACKAAVSEDEQLMDLLRSRIVMDVDRNKVAISVSLSDPEK